MLEKTCNWTKKWTPSPAFFKDFHRLSPDLHTYVNFYGFVEGQVKSHKEQDKVLRFHPLTPMIKSCSFCDCDGNHTEKSYVSKNIKKNNLH